MHFLPLFGANARVVRVADAVGVPDGVPDARAEAMLAILPSDRAPAVGEQEVEWRSRTRGSLGIKLGEGGGGKTQMAVVHILLVDDGIQFCIRGVRKGCPLL